MDTLTHGLAGALLARGMPSTGDAAFDRLLRRREAWVGFFTAMFPDMDVVPNPFSAEFYIAQHRGLTHSFVLLPLWAVLLALVSSLRRPRAFATLPDERRRIAVLRLVAVSGLGVLSHILLDWVTSWGTMFFAPLTWRRYALDWVFILDLVLLGLLLAGLLGTRLATRLSDTKGRWAARAAIVVATVYVFFCGERHREAMVLVAGVGPPNAVERAAIPQPLSPDRWLLLADDGNEITARYVDLGKRGRDPTADPLREAIVDAQLRRDGLGLFWKRLDALYRAPAELSVRVIPKSNGPLATRTLAEGIAGVFGRFARFPTARQEPEKGGTTAVLLRDVRFGYLSTDVDPFTYLVRYDAAGQVVFAGFPSGRWSHESPAANLGAAR